MSGALEGRVYRVVSHRERQIFLLRLKCSDARDKIIGSV